LPHRFIPQHKLLLYYNDLIIDILKLADENNLTSIEMEIDNLPIIKEDKLIDWLINNSYEEEAILISAKHLYFSLLRDFIFYMHESFSCAERGKVTVAYTVSRKPLKDNLLYFCWLLNDYKDFTNI